MFTTAGICCGLASEFHTVRFKPFSQALIFTFY